MTTVVTGRFGSSEAAAHAVSRLIESGFVAADTGSFAVKTLDLDPPPPATASEGAETRAGATIGSEAVAGMVGGTTVGLALGAASATFLGPPGLIAGAAIGAYAGSLVGTLAGQSEASEDDPPPPAAAASPTDTLVAVRAPESAQQLSAIEVLRTEGAVEIKKVQGDLSNGKWLDFDPSTYAAAIKL
jgi:hypothetical protein